MNKRNDTVWRIRELAEENGIKNAHELHLESRAGISYPRTKKLWDLNVGAFSANELQDYANLFGVPIQKLLRRPQAALSSK